MFFLVLDIGNADIEALPIGVRMIDGLIQAAAVRAAGFATVVIAGLAPAVKCVEEFSLHVNLFTNPAELLTCL